MAKIASGGLSLAGNAQGVGFWAAALDTVAL